MKRREYCEYIARSLDLSSAVNDFAECKMKF